MPFFSIKSTTSVNFSTLFPVLGTYFSAVWKDRFGKDGDPSGTVEGVVLGFVFVAVRTGGNFGETGTPYLGIQYVFIPCSIGPNGFSP